MGWGGEAVLKRAECDSMDLPGGDDSFWSLLWLCGLHCPGQREEPWLRLPVPRR